tara:strand:+ start:356 stop:736 length:381 start_codon:yes stop_codon:yes gene_type:complete
MYKELNKVFSMIKTELKSEKVELALELGGIKTMSSALKGSIKSYNRKFETLDDLVGDLQREAKELDKRADKFFKEVDLIKKEGEKQASDLGVKFSNTPIGKEVNSIETSILTGELATIKQGLKIKI